MNREFIPYEQALELKELGFDEKCFGYYVLLATNKIELVLEETSKEFYKAIADSIEDTKRIPEDFYTLAPLYQQAFRWFRKQVFPQIVINEKGDSVQGMLSLLPLVYLNNYEIQVIKESIYHTLDNFSGAEIPSYQAAHIFNGYTVPTYEEAELACLKKLIEIVKNK